MDIQNPKGFTVNSIYEPDKERMLRALRAILDAPKRRKDDIQSAEHADAKSGGAA